MPVKILKGITHSRKINNIRIRVTGTLFIVADFIYVPWMIYHLNTQALWLSVPFLLVNLYTAILVPLVIFNNWSKSVPLLFKLPEGSEDMVAVIIPTYGEPLEMLQLTIKSVLEQNWPADKLLIVVGDDGHRNEVRVMVEQLQSMYTATRIMYHLPPSKKSPDRKGSAKDGNLNSMLDFVSRHFPDVKYIETRDADDLIGDADFMRYTVGHLISSPKTAYVQTIKEAYVSPGDPFGNTQSVFYRELMLSKNAANAVFPCGSGLVWRKESLDKIGGFPTWNLVEDLYSGYVAMQHGFKNAYLPIVGAVGQTAPEDIPNVYKQLGTWALDTLRIFFWKSPWVVKGLKFRQKMQFTELGMFYMLGLPLLVLILMPACSLIFNIQPIQSDNGNYLVHAWIYAAMLEILFLNLGGDTSFKLLWRGREMCFGLIFVYIKAGFLALIYGPNRKPTYKVTRKVQQAGLYFKEAFFHILLLLFLLFSMGYYAIHHQNIAQFDFGSFGWAFYYALLLFGFVRKSWFGLGKEQPVQQVKGKQERGSAQGGQVSRGVQTKQAVSRGGQQKKKGGQSKKGARESQVPAHLRRPGTAVARRGGQLSSSPASARAAVSGGLSSGQNWRTSGSTGKTHIPLPGMSPSGSGPHIPLPGMSPSGSGPHIPLPGMGPSVSSPQMPVTGPLVSGPHVPLPGMGPSVSSPQMPGTGPLGSGMQAPLPVLNPPGPQYAGQMVSGSGGGIMPESSRQDYGRKELIVQQETREERVVVQPAKVRKPKGQFILPPTLNT